MDKIIKITKRGRITLPFSFRMKLGVNNIGGKLHIRYDKKNQQIMLSKLSAIDELSHIVSLNVKPDTIPLMNVNNYYQNNRTVYKDTLNKKTFGD